MFYLNNYNFADLWENPEWRLASGMDRGSGCSVRTRKRRMGRLRQSGQLRNKGRYYVLYLLNNNHNVSVRIFIMCSLLKRIGFVLRHVVYISIAFSGVVNLSIEYYLPKFGKTIKNTPLLHRKYLILSIYSCFSGDFIIPVAITGEVHYKWCRNRPADPFICAPSKVRGTNWQFTFVDYDIGKSSFKRPNPTISLIHSPFLFQKHGIALAAGDIIVNLRLCFRQKI